MFIDRFKLLIKIAKLEGIKDAIEHRKPSRELLDKLNELNNLMLEEEQQEKDIKILKSQVEILKWVLGEI